MSTQQRRLEPRSETLGQLVEITVDDELLTFGWGQAHQLGTAAYWVEQTRHRGQPHSYRLGSTLAEEVCACILGGHGIPAAVGLAAYSWLRHAGLLQPPGDAAAIAHRLRAPLTVPSRPHPVRYRFATQRAERVSAALERLASSAPPTDPLELREFLLGFRGIGPKTASWIVRNWTSSDDVAIIDIHVQRAGVAAGFFSPRWRLPRDYARFERAFCAAARLGGVSAAALDACMWDQMQALGRAQELLLGTSGQRVA